MARPNLPLLFVQTVPNDPSREPRSGSAPALVPGRYQSGAIENEAGLTSKPEPLLACTTEGEIVSLFGSHSPCGDTDMCEEDCSPIEDASPDTPRSTSRSPCGCPFIAVHRIMEAAKRCTFAHLTRGHVYRTRQGEERPIMSHWMQELVARNLDQAYEVCAVEIRRVAEIVRPNGWPVHDGKIPSEQYSGHVQPWMRATAQRHACWAANAALSEIQQRGGFKDTSRPSFNFELPGRLDPDLLHHPCQCKEGHALNIASEVLYDTMRKICPLLPTSTNCSLTEDRVKSHCQTWKVMRAHIHSAMLDGLKGVAEADDISHLCSGQTMIHVRPWMTKAIRRHCLIAAHVHSKRLLWKMRDLRISQLQDWLENVYRQEAEDDAMIKNI